MVGAALVGWTIGYAIAAATRAVDGPALVLPVPALLRRFVGR